MALTIKTKLALAGALAGCLLVMTPTSASTTEVRQDTGTLSTAAVSAGGPAASPDQAASDRTLNQAGRSGSVTRTYNPNAPLGSPDNPEILDGQDQALLSVQQFKALLDGRKARLEQAKSGKTAQAAAGCIIGAYWSTCKSYPGFGALNLATELGSDHHEYIRQQGWLYTSGYWQTYMDRSWNGGANWDGKHGFMLNSSGWGDEIYDGPPYVARGCLYNSSTKYIACTGWH